MPGVWSLKAVLPDFVDMNFFWSQNGRERRSVYRKFTESSRLRSVVVQGLEALWLLTSWDFEGRIVCKKGLLCKPVDKPAEGGGCE